MTTTEPNAAHFISEIIEADLAAGKHDGQVVTRFPPEPNGYLHIGHAKAVWLNFSLAESFGGACNLRFDDTNPAKEEDEYVRSITEDVRWLGWEPASVVFASDYFDRMAEWAEQLIQDGLAYVCDLSHEETKAMRGSLTEPGRPSPHRDRSPAENLDLFRQMRDGAFEDGSRTLRAKIDMASPNLNLRDPVMYRILRTPHHRTGDRWSIYPMYDWAHGLEDSIEGVTHSICTLEFENHRPLYDWFLERLDIHHPQQIEFSRFNLTYTVMSKRHLITLVHDGHVDGWDDPRLWTIAGLRRRGVTPEAINAVCEETGVTKFVGRHDYALLENALRTDLNKRAERRMAVLDPIRLVIENYPEGQSEELDAVNNPEDPSAGTRPVPFARELYIERDDFMEDPPKKFFRLGPGREVRLRYAYFVTCTGMVKDDDGNVTEIRCTYDPATRGGNAPDGRKVKGTIHWVSAPHAIDADVHLLDRLFTAEVPDDPKLDGSFIDRLNPASREIRSNCKLEPSLGETTAGQRYQFERLGYFTRDPDGHFLRTVGLRDSWAKAKAKG